jgi:2-oxoglutarate ferredoxin oxidoreductase subunit alpha
MVKEFLEGNFAMAEAAVRAGVEAYFGYPITPQTELLEWMSQRMPELKRVFLQAESEIAAINMVYGAACTGARVMSSSSSPGVSLMQEGLSYIAGTEVPIVLIDVMRGGPGLGNIAPSQGDYNQIVHGGGHGDYHAIVLAPASVQEAIDLTVLAFDLAEKYRSICFVLADGSIGQMMEPAELPEMRPLRTTTPDWATDGCLNRDQRILTSILIDPTQEEVYNHKLLDTWYRIQANEIRYKEYYLDDAEYVVIGFGTAGRIALSPFPFEQIEELVKTTQGFLVTEMNTGQMLEDVKQAVKGQVPIEFYARIGGVVPYPDEILTEIKRLVHEPKSPDGDPRQRWMQRLKDGVISLS